MTSCIVSYLHSHFQSSEIKKAKRKFEESVASKDAFSVDDSEDDEDAEGATSSDEDLAETTQEKKLRLAKKYLEEIEKQGLFLCSSFEAVLYFHHVK